MTSNTVAKRKCISNVEKLNILNEIESSKKKKDIAEKYGIPASTLSTIIKNKTKIFEQASVIHERQNHKKIRLCDYNDVNEAMLRWITAKRQMNLPISGPIIKEKAKEFAVAFGRTNFTASNGWLHKFKKRHNIVGKVVCGEGADVNLETADTWVKQILPNLIKNYKIDDIFNADETALFYKCLPSKTLAFKSEKCIGGKKSKDRITVMVGSNLSGTEKLKILVIGKSANPRCFKGLKSLEVDYKSNSKAWMTSEIFQNWLIKLDRKFIREKRHILLFIDNCPAHPKSVQDKLKNIKLVFFPPNMTSSLQPMDQGIIQNLKQCYRQRILKKILFYSDEKTTFSISLLDAIRDLGKAWEDVKAATISNCFKKAGFVKTSDEELLLSDDDDIPLANLLDVRENNEDGMSLQELWSKCVSDETDISFHDFMNVDNDVVTMADPSDEDILQSILNDEYGFEVSDEEEVEEIIKLPNFSETLSAIQTVRTFVESRTNVPDNMFASMKLLEDYLDKEKMQATKQTKIHEFLTK